MDETPKYKFTRRVLRELREPDTFFYTRDGRVLKSLWELIAYLNECENESFEHHVNLDKNDFADWIRDVIRDEELAEEIDWYLSREVMRGKIIERINGLVSSVKASRRPVLQAVHILEDSQTPEELFFAKDGRVLRNLWELEEFLRNVDDETFAHHVNEERNDFAEWVWEVVQDYELGRMIAETTQKEEMNELVNDRLLELEKLAGSRAFQRWDGKRYVKLIKNR
ncbi:MAG: hypothetical protein JXB14_04605 [Candidatus Altiarchaeota archaeon]|nr:hypothetical protein [Candidatus Altiarchaeota archaeon]